MTEQQLIEYIISLDDAIQTMETSEDKTHYYKFTKTVANLFINTKYIKYIEEYRQV